MADERYVVLALATARATWFRDVARWATSGVAPLDFVKCLSPTEVTARLESGRQFSALLVDSGLPGLDRDLIELGNQRDCPVLVIGDHLTNWQELGAVAQLPTELTRAQLLDALATHAHLVGKVEAEPSTANVAAPVTPWRGQLVAVTGARGSGASTIAMALAQGLGSDVRHAGMVLLADLALDADLAMYHDAREVVPGLQELVDAHRSGRPGASELRGMTFDIVSRRYSLLLGLRRHRDWTVLRSRALEAAIDNTRSAFHVMVADIEPDLEGDAETGSTDVEDRNLVARTIARQADVVVVVGDPGLKGLHATGRVLRDLRSFGVEPERILAIMNRAPRQARARAEFARAFAALCGPTATSAPVPVPHRRGLEELHRDAGRFPDAIVEPVTGAVRSLLDRLPAFASEQPEPVAIAPGSLGTWADDEAAQ